MDVNEVYSQPNKMTPLFQVSFVQIKSALVSGIIMAFFAIVGYVLQTGDIFSLDWRTIANVAVLAGLTAATSYLKSGLTTSQGNFAGLVKIAE